MGASQVGSRAHDGGNVENEFLNTWIFFFKLIYHSVFEHAKSSMKLTPVFVHEAPAGFGVWSNYKSRNILKVSSRFNVSHEQFLVSVKPVRSFPWKTKPPLLI